MRRERPDTLIDLAVRNVGLFKAPFALAALAEWVIAMNAEGPEDFDVEAYQRYWRCSRAQAYKDQAKWRAAFPGLDPLPIVQASRQVYAAKLAEYEARDAEKRQARDLATVLAMMAVPS